MRVRNSLYNVIIAAIYYILMTVIGLFLRKVFIECLGLEYVGLDTVFANILSFLSLVELGIGPAITYRLYKPLADGDKKEIQLLMAVYKRFYRYVAIIITGIGLILILFIPIIINDAPIENEPLAFAYILYLTSTVASYGLAHKRSLLVADQKQYLTTIVDIIFNICVLLIKVVVLKLTGSYYLVLVINIIRVLMSNICISIICDKQHSYIKQKNSLLKNEVDLKAKSMVLDIKYIMLHKLCNYIYSSTDGIVISSFMGVANVGLLSNYNMIVSVVNSLFMQCSSSIQSSIGNLVSTFTENKESIHNILKRLNYIYYSVLSFCTTSLFCLLTPFIRIWIGEDYTISMGIILVICINMYIYSFYQPIANVYTVVGLFKEDKVTSPLAAIINIVVSVLTVKKFGLIGVYVGTILGSLVYIIGRTNIVYQKYFEETSKLYYAEMMKYFIITCAECLLTYIFTCCIPGAGIISFIGKILLCIIVPNGINIILFRKSEEFNYCYHLVIKLMKRGK